jgi:hypothetical protein
MITLEISAGDLLDRLAILELKLARCDRDEQRALLGTAVERARAARRAARLDAPGLPQLEQELAAVNGALWDAEDEVRARERRGDFGAAFVAVARTICRLNDRRSGLKGAIDSLCGFPATEAKTYSGPERPDDERGPVLHVALPIDIQRG